MAVTCELIPCDFAKNLTIFVTYRSGGFSVNRLQSLSFRIEGEQSPNLALVS